jgi:hypothetical protein
MQKYYDASQEELEFYEFKADLKKQLVASAATEELKESLQRDADEASFEIRWIQQRIGDEKRALDDAINALAYNQNWDASVKSQQEFETENAQNIADRD